MSKRVEGRSYGQRVPPLTSVIKSILERYPDGGQILKEIIQNADDASATTISFLLDSRGSPYGKSSLYNDKLAKFQGPALYSFNNARFEQEDWDGLQSLMDSSKKEEPLKVGRFGIGFNSIYHVTDLPSVVSGQLLAFLDPHEEYFGKKETGQQFDLREPLIQNYEDQFSPFEDVLGCKISSQFLKGTLFRFPLRTEASKLSQKPYTTDKVRHLFQSLKDEASLILLFLKNIEEINLYETDENQREKLVFRVRLEDCSRKKVREQRQKLLLQVPEWESGHQTVLQLELEMVIEIFDTTTGTKQEKWITHNRIGDKEAKMRQRALNLHLLPWVGFAAPLSVAGGSRIGSNGGRIFCFLPLPPDADAKTGYPVHIHGYFGLTDNRRGLKWPGPECQNDDMAEWNVDLMWYVGSQAYASLLQSMTTRLPVSPDMISIFYQCWPDKQYVNKHWKEIIDNVYNLLLSESVFWTRSYGGRWLSLNQAVLERFENLSAETKAVVKKVLQLANEPVVSLPLHVDEYVRINASGTRLVTPTYLRTILKQNRKGSWDMQKMSREERISMLEYIVTDNNFADFEGIALLPLADGRFITFKAGQRCGTNDVVYVETPDNSSTLLPGTESRFLDTNIKQKVLLPIAGTAVDANELHQSYFQLVRLNPRSVISLLRQVLPKNMFLSDPVVWNPSRGNHPSEAWLVQFWKWLVRTFPYDLTLLEGFPLIKCSSGQHTALAKLKSDTKTIRQKSNETGMPLPQDVVSLLKKAGVVVLPEVPHYMMQHACFSMYVADASPEGVLKVLRNIGIQRSIAAVTASNVQEIRSLRELLSSLRANLSNDERQFLKSLPIFEAIDQTSFIDAQNKPSTAPRGFASQITLKIKNASCILSVEDDASNQLLKVLNIPEMTMGQFLTREVFPHLSCYTTQEVTSLMCWVLRRIDVFRCEPNFCTHLSTLNFVNVGQRSLARPQDIFNPGNELNKRLLEGEESKFPVGEFAKDDILVPLRNHLGLKNTLDHVDVANLAMNLHRFDINQRRRKAMALLEFLGKYSSLLTRNVNVGGGSQMLQDVFRNVAWVPCAKDPPLGYPRCMPWKSDGNGLLTPQQVVASKYGVVVGSVMSVLQSESTISIKSVFGWDKGPDGSKVLEQLRIACNEIDVKSFQGNEREQFWRMLKTIYETLAVNDYCHSLFQADFAWIWNGQGFSSPSKIAFRRQTNFDLDPYLHTIPKEIQEGELCDFFPKFGVKSCFTDEDLLDVLLDIKAKHDNANAKLDRDVIAKDKQLALDILHWIVREGPLNPDLRDKVYVPVTKGPGILNLVPLTECTFCDAAWLRGNFLELQMLPELSMIDESISNTTASHLGVPPMSRCVTAPEALGFEQAGPYEPITRRLKNILDEYKEGAGVFKELIQNADDAGATEVKFLVDWRQHPAKKLLAEGMKESQGPALLAYNNAVFTKKDFENINKLAGATKKEDLDKIGRFGLGFNSVYHFTDTPSFVSSTYAVFFDPDTKHLDHFITNPSHPGIKLNLAVNSNTLLCYPDQFQPYQGVFQCDVNGDMPFNFDGTLFRFPFRRGPSEICDKQYNERDVKALLESFNRSASSLLLNTQNVQHVSVWELDHRAKEPSDVKLLTKVERNILSDSGGSNLTTFLHECATWSSKRDEHLPQRTKIISITHTTTEDEQKARTEYWLQCDGMGDAESLEMARSKEGRQKGLLSCAGIAVNLNESKGGWKVKRTDGEAFCFLPLSIPTGLPVHVNGYFAVTSNRRGIWEQTAEERQSFQPVEARWNKALMKDGIAQAYVELLKETKRMAQEGDLQEYNFCSLWPNPDCLQSQVWKPLIVGVYTLISSSSMKLLKCRKEWHSVSECFFRDDELKKIPGVLDILHGTNIVDIPKFARNGFCAAGCGDEIEKRTLTQEKFLVQIFFPSIEKIRDSLRNKVVCYVIDECLSSSNSEKKTLFQELLSTNACIPCSADQQVLARPRDLIHPRAAAASLYSPCDNKMPVGDCFLEPKRLLELESCGMTTDVLNWDQILERAKSVQTLDYVDGLKRISALVQYLNQVIDQMPLCTNEISNGIASLAVFPIMAKPEGYMFPWQGDMFDSQTMLSSSELFGQEYANVIGSLRPVLDESEETGCGPLNQKVRRLFRLSDRTPSLEDAINQLQIVCQHFEKSKTTIGCVPLRHLNNLCSDIYKFLHTFVGKEEEATLIARLEGLSWILVEDHFVKSAELAFKWNGNGAPYLYRVPRSLANSQLLVAVRVKTTFDVSDFLSALSHMKAAKKDERLDDAEFKISKVFLDELNGVLKKIPKDAVGCTPMPDRDRVLRPARGLVINDTPWMVIEMDKEVKYVHDDISIKLAHALGARDIRSKSLEDISRPIGQPFGQNELLTDRLANILKSYPCDFGILKELLQNADDAKATEIHFVYDPRQLGKERLFKDSWKELQGPALCVYNNRPFSEKDLEGIQRLGIGSKADSPEKTGQYGIGFNAVYHLTDCPSFITDGNTLCILDPHARYAPGATREKPGRLFGPFEKSGNFQENYRDVFPGYLGDMFDLKGSTMFRFPLRNKEMAKKSLISKEVIESIDLFLRNFQREAKEALLFLNNVKKISVSTVRENRLELNYQVSALLEEQDEQKRRELAAHVRESKGLATQEIKKIEVTYPVTLREKSTEEKWIVQQTVGVGKNSSIEIPDGRQNGLLPRAGVAAKVTTYNNFGKERLESTSPGPDKRKAFCFLPLPVFTGLPVHVNGHFALDSGRRHLWQDENGSGFRTKWNNFMKTEVIADAYVTLLIEARKHVPHLKDGPVSPYFSTVHERNLGLEWYQKLFPSNSEGETQWGSVVAAVLNKIARQDVPVFPVVRQEGNGKKMKHPCNWLSSSNGFFTSSECSFRLEGILRSIGFNLLSLKHGIFRNFKEVEAPVTEVTPEEVISFLSTHNPILRQLPCPLQQSSIGTVIRYIEVLLYCMKSTSFAERLDGVPLLLTKDGFLRLFSKIKPVFLSAFHHLVPSSKHFEKFSIKELTEALEYQCDDLFKQQNQVVVPMKLADLATFLPFLFKEHKPWNTTSTPVFWDPDNHDQELAKWLIELWDFITTEYSKNPSDDFLEPLKSWPVFPITARQLVPVSLSKTILDLTEQDSWAPTQKRLVGVLRKLQCPEVDMKLLISKAASVPAVVKSYLTHSEVDMSQITSKVANISAVFKPYLAYPNSIDDVIIVLDYLMKRDRDISGRITAKEAELLLQFLQEDSETLVANTRNVSVLRKLPFFKTIDGRLINLEGASAVCKVPQGIPLEESHVWMMGATNYVFLEPCHSLDVIHQMLGVQLKSQTSCYIDFIFPVFSLLKVSTRIRHLSFIIDALLYDPKNNEANQLKMALNNLAFIPNEATGLLCKASDFYDPTNQVFKALLTTDKFPGKPFDSPEWIPFLQDIGLLQTLSQAQVLRFAKEIENQAVSGVTKQLLYRSTVLTQYLLQETSLHEAYFLQNISSVHFVVAHRVDKRLTSVLKQFSSDKDKSGCLTCFRDAVREDYEQLVWSSAALLPAWAVSDDEQIRNHLGILQEPSLNQVVVHAYNICTKFSKSTDVDLETSLRELLLEIMEEIYKYLQRSSLEFHDTYLQRLSKMPLALVENGGVFIQCKQMVFEMQEFEEQPPYLYRVPRSYGRFEGLFKKLGTTEKPMPLQYANILEEIWNGCKENTMHKEEMRLAKQATSGFFRALKRLHFEDQRTRHKTTCAESLKDVIVIYFPTQKGKLRPSNQLFHMYDCPQLLERVKAMKSNFELMIELSDIGFRYDHPEELLSYLPQHLKVNSITKVLKEELHPECLDKKCRLDGDGECTEASRLREILGSQQFTDGLVRIFKAQERKATIEEEMRQKIENLRTMFTIVCFENLETVIKNDSGEEIEGSRKVKSHLFIEDDNTVCLFIRHGTKSNISRNVKLCELIYKHLDGALNSVHFLHVQNLMMIKQAVKIPDLLDEMGIRRDVQQLASGLFEGNPGAEIPPEEHYLLMMYEEFIFRPDEIVGYKEEDDDLESEQGKYIYARIIEKTSPPRHEKKEEKRLKKLKKKRKKEIEKKRIAARMENSDSSKKNQQKENPLVGWYLIDIGTGTPVVAEVLDLYKLKRPQEVDDASMEEKTFLYDQNNFPFNEGEEQPPSTSAAKPRTWEKIKKEICQALADIMSLPKEKQRKAVKRLYLRWHPDKNPKEMEELANKAMKFIQDEFKRLSSGAGVSGDGLGGASSASSSNQDWYDTFYGNLNRRAQQQRSTYDNYRRQRNSFRSRSSHGASFGQSSEFHTPDASMARIWISQSRADLRSVDRLFEADDELYWLICFQCSQVVEKALKGAMYAVCGLTDDQLMSHDLIWLASELRNSPNGPDVLYLSGELRNHHVPTRYPSKQPPARPPKDVFTLQQAERARQVARNVLQILEEFIGILHI